MFSRKTLNFDICQTMYEQQMVQHAKTIAQNEANMKLGIKQNCTEVISSEYAIYLLTEKQWYKGGRFASKRCKNLFDLIQEQDTEV